MSICIVYLYLDALPCLYTRVSYDRFIIFYKKADIYTQICTYVHTLMNIYIYIYKFVCI